MLSNHSSNRHTAAHTAACHIAYRPDLNGAESSSSNRSFKVNTSHHKVQTTFWLVWSPIYQKTCSHFLHCFCYLSISPKWNEEINATSNESHKTKKKQWFTLQSGLFLDNGFIRRLVESAEYPKVTFNLDRLIGKHSSKWLSSSQTLN